MTPHTRCEERGFTLAELLVGVFLMSVGALAAAPLFMHAMHGNASSRDLGWVGVAVEQRIEILRSKDYDSLFPGGSVTSAVTGYVDTRDPEVEVRWSIVDNSTNIPGTKIIAVRGIRRRVGSGPAGQVTTITLRGN
jgi:prepilin-type N-terminal cleavage/methylation domain-containing protein